MNGEYNFLANIEVSGIITLRDSMGCSMSVNTRRQFDNVKGYVASCVSSGKDAIWYKGVDEEVTLRIPKDKCKGLLDFLSEVERVIDKVEKTIERTL